MNDIFFERQAEIKREKASQGLEVQKQAEKKV